METTVSERISEYDYLPFCNSEKLVHLDEESTLKFSESDELPVIEGATALLPVYCSLAEAVYPSTTVAWCTKDSDGNFHFNDDKKIIVDYNYGTRSAYNNLIDRKVDIIFVAYPSQEQIDEALKNNVEFNYTPIGKEAFVFFVNKKKPVDIQPCHRNIPSYRNCQVRLRQSFRSSRCRCCGKRNSGWLQRNLRSNLTSRHIHQMRSKHILRSGLLVQSNPFDVRNRYNK